MQKRLTPSTLLKFALLYSFLIYHSVTWAETYFIGPEGDDHSSGQSSGRAWKTFARAFEALEPGDTLTLLDGEYRRDTTGLLHADSSNAANGEPGRPITIRSQNERKAWIRSDGEFALSLLGLSWWDIEGLRVSSADNADAPNPGDPLRLHECADMEVRRLLVHNNNRYKNSACFSVSSCQRVLLEECEIYYFHRNGFSCFKSSDITVRRCYANSRGQADVQSGYGSHPVSQGGGDRAFVGYYSSRMLFENCVSENRNSGFGGISGFATASGESSGENFRFLGCISIGDFANGAMQSREKDETSRPARDLLFRDFLMVGSLSKGFVSRAVQDLTMENVTVFDNSGSAFLTNTERQGAWPSAEEIGGASYRLRNWLVVGTSGPALLLDNEGLAIDFVMEHSNLWNTEGLGIDESIEDAAGRIRHSVKVQPTGIGRGKGEALVYVPRHSNMAGAGKNGRDIGANILYRYENASLTSRPLWDSRTGAFPHGAVVEGVNDLAGTSLFDLHQRLNVRPNQLPYE